MSITKLTTPQRKALWRAAQVGPARHVHCGRQFRAFESLAAMGLGTSGRKTADDAGRWFAIFTINQAGRDREAQEPTPTP